MKTKIFTFLFFLISIIIYSQEQVAFPTSWFINEPSNENPYGKSNASNQIQPNDYNKLIGTCRCESRRMQPDGKWGKPISLKWKWKWKYIMNGNAVQDEGWYGNEKNATYFTSIRVYDKTKKHWYVTYFSPNQANEPNTWTGGLVNKNIVLKGIIKTPSGGVSSILTFSNISKKGFDWEGKIFSSEKDTTGRSFWKINCKKIY